MVWASFTVVVVSSHHECDMVCLFLHVHLHQHGQDPAEQHTLHVTEELWSKEFLLFGLGCWHIA